MASYSKTTAISLRKGNTSENNSFTGVRGELVADLGVDGTGTDLNTTIRLHNGITQGGIPLARTDLTNVTTKTLAENRTIYNDKNLAYADLTNFEETTDSTTQNKIVTAFGEYGLAKTDMSNVDTVNLATEGTGHTGKNLSYADFSNTDTANLATAGAGHAGKNLAYVDMSNVDTVSLAVKDSLAPHAGKNLAYADLANLETSTDASTINKIVTALDSYGIAKKNMSNVNTADLATTGAGHAGKNLAYADTTNINTADLVDTTKHDGSSSKGKPLAYADGTNLNTTILTTAPAEGPVLTKADLTNVTDTTIKGRLDSLTVNNTTYHTEYTNNKKDTITSSNKTNTTYYPSIKATADYVDNSINALQAEYAEIDFANVTDFNKLYEKATSNTVIYDNTPSNIMTKGSGFTTDVAIATSGSDIIQVPTIVPTSYTLSNTIPLQLAVYGITTETIGNDAHQIINQYRVQPEYGKTNITATTIHFKNSQGSVITATLTCRAHSSISGGYCYFITIDHTIPGNDNLQGWQGVYDVANAPLYDNTDNIEVLPLLGIHPTQIDSSGGITQFVYVPTTGESINDTNINIYHPMLKTTYAIQSGNNGNGVLKTVIKTPGAGLIRCDFENLPGVTAYDKACNINTNWTINKVDAIPAVTETSISDREYNRIATVGQVWNCAKKIDSKITFRSWS